MHNKLLNEMLFDALDDTRRGLAPWRFDYNHVRLYHSLANMSPVDAHPALERTTELAPVPNQYQ